MLIYLDTNIIIYSVENPPHLGLLAQSRLDAAMKNGDKFAISDLSRLECRCNPMGTGDQVRLMKFDTLFTTPEVQKVSIDTAVFDRATVIRATYKFKTADALHLAAAVENGCHVFLTNDTRLSAFSDITVEVL
jgi:predicted nucleic acid-binding protein